VQTTDVNLDDGEPSKKKAKQDASEKQITEKSIDYPSLEASLAVKAGKAGVGFTKRTNPTILLVHTLLDFFETQGRLPENRETDADVLKELEKQVVERLSLDDSIAAKLDKQSWWDNVYGEISPVSAIVGGALGQDIIRAISAKETPIKNFFLFNGIECNGIIESIGK